MKDYLKYGSYIIISLVFAYICLTLRDCSHAGDTSGVINTPADTAYLPVIVRSYTPKSTPFEKPVKPISKLPKGVKEKDVKRVITISGKKLLQIIETKNGDVLVSKNGDSLEVVVTNYFDPIFEFGLYANVGITVDVRKHFSPSASLAFIRWYGIIDAPVVVADDDGIGLGIGFKLYYAIYVTPVVMWSFETTDKSINLNLSYQL